MAAFPDITTCIVDVKSGPLLLGQADGIACRTMEMFEAFGFSERVLREAYWVTRQHSGSPAKQTSRKLSATAGYKTWKTGFQSFRT